MGDYDDLAEQVMRSYLERMHPFRRSGFKIGQTRSHLSRQRHSSQHFHHEVGF
jgi:hypothetical protein